MCCCGCKATQPVILLGFAVLCMGKSSERQSARLEPNLSTAARQETKQITLNKSVDALQSIMVDRDGSTQMFALEPNSQHKQVGYHSHYMRSEPKAPPLNEKAYHQKAMSDPESLSLSQKRLDPWMHTTHAQWKLSPQARQDMQRTGEASIVRTWLQGLMNRSSLVVPVRDSRIHMLKAAMSITTPGSLSLVLPVIRTTVHKLSGKYEYTNTMPKSGSLLPSPEPATKRISKFGDASSLLDVDSRGEPGQRVHNQMASAEEWAASETDIQQTLFEMMLHFVVIVSFAVSYAQNVVAKRPRVTTLFEYESQRRAQEACDEEVFGGDGFNFSLCGCCRDLHYMAWSFACPHIRAADTLAAAGIVSFETGLMLYLVIFLCQHFGPAFNLLGMLVIAVPLASNRRKIREKYGGKQSHGCKDYAVSACCWSCAVCQEARHVDDATQTSVRCCCRIEFYGDPFATVVGPAVQIGDKSVLDAIRRNQEKNSLCPQEALQKVASVKSKANGKNTSPEVVKKEASGSVKAEDSDAVKKKPSEAVNKEASQDFAEKKQEEEPGGQKEEQGEEVVEKTSTLPWLRKSNLSGLSQTLGPSKSSKGTQELEPEDTRKNTLPWTKKY